MGKNYWMVVQTRENFEISRELGFTVHGLTKKQRRRADRMRPEDKLLFYVSDIRKWTVAATITSRSFEDRSSVWVAAPRGELFPFRVSLRPDIMLDEQSYVDGLQLGPRLEYVKRWAPEDWPLAFVDTLHLIPQRDFRLIEGEMRRITCAGRNSRRNNRQQPHTSGPGAGLPVTDTYGGLSDTNERPGGDIPRVETVAADQETANHNGQLTGAPDNLDDIAEVSDSTSTPEGHAAESLNGESTQATTAEAEEPASSGDTSKATNSPEATEGRAAEPPEGESGHAMAAEANGPGSSGDTAEASNSLEAPESHAAEGVDGESTQVTTAEMDKKSVIERENSEDEDEEPEPQVA